MKLLIDGMILTPVQCIKKFRREKFKLYVLSLEMPFCFHATQLMEVITLNYMDNNNNRLLKNQT